MALNDDIAKVTSNPLTDTSSVYQMKDLVNAQSTLISGLGGGG